MYGIFCQHLPQTLPKGTSITTKPGMVTLVKQCLHHQNMFMATSHKHGKIGVHPIALPTSCMFFFGIYVLSVYMNDIPFMYHGPNGY